MCCYSGVPGLRTSSVNLIWSQWENFAFISSVGNCVIVNTSAHLNLVLRDAQKVCALTKVGTVLKLVCRNHVPCVILLYSLSDTGSVQWHVYKTWTGVHGPPDGPGPWTTPRTTPNFQKEMPLLIWKFTRGQGMKNTDYYSFLMSLRICLVITGCFRIVPP